MRSVGAHTRKRKAKSKAPTAIGTFLRFATCEMVAPDQSSLQSARN